MKTRLPVLLGLLWGASVLGAGTLASLSTGWHEGQYLVKIYAPGVTDYQTLWLSRTTPKMLVIDFMDATYRLPKRRYPVREAAGLLAIRGSQFQTEPRRIARLVLDLSDSLPYSIQHKADTFVVALTTARGKARRPEVFTSFTPKTARDPFTPWFQAESKDTLFNPLKGELVGIVESDQGERYALLQEPSKPGFILKKGDPVLNGVVLAVTSNSVVFYVKQKGIPRRIVLSMEKRKATGR